MLNTNAKTNELQFLAIKQSNVCALVNAKHQVNQTENQRWINELGVAGR